MSREDETLNEALAAFGITSDAGPHGSRFLRDGASTLGSATANQAWSLVSFLRAKRAQGGSEMSADGLDKGNRDCLAKRRDGEPVFILLGRDPDAHNIVRMWAERRLAAGGDPEHCQMGLDIADRMKAYAADPVNAPKSAPPASAYRTVTFAETTD